MFLFKKRKKAKPVDVARIRLQVEMVQVLLNNGYSWDQIFDAIGFSETWLKFTQTHLPEWQKRI